MEVPKNTRLYESPISTHWIDEDGIMCAVSKNVERTIEHCQNVIDFYAMFAKDGKKICLLSDARKNLMPLTKEVRDYVTAELPKYIKAHAILSESSLGATQVSTIIKLSFHGFPVRLFSKEEDARRWLKDFL